MSKKYILKEVDASSENGDKIIVEQVFEKIIDTHFFNSKRRCIPLFRIVIRDKVIMLNEDLSFIHPRTGKIFKIAATSNI